MTTHETEAIGASDGDALPSGSDRDRHDGDRPAIRTHPSRPVPKAELAGGRGPEAEGALWRGVYRRLRGMIESGELPSGARLPTQAQMMRDHGVSRHVVRRALAALSDGGLVVTWQGKGAFVREARFDYRIGARPRFAEGVDGAPRAAATQVLRTQRRSAPPAIAKMLGLSRRDNVLLGELLRLVDGRPTVLTRHWFDGGRLPRMLDLIREHGSVTEALAICGVDDCVCAQTVVQTRVPSPYEALTLEIAPSQPVLISTDLNADQDRRPVEVAEAIWRGDAVNLIV